MWFLQSIRVNCDFATRFALSGEFLFAARQKEPKALDRQRSSLRLRARAASIRYSDSGMADSGCRVQGLLETLAKPGLDQSTMVSAKTIERGGWLTKCARVGPSHYAPTESSWQPLSQICGSVPVRRPGRLRKTPLR